MTIHSPVSSKMTRHVHSCAPEDSLARAAGVMWEKDCGWLPIIDAAGKLVGVITDRDICMAAMTQGIRLDEGRVDGVMARQVVCTKASDAVSDLEHVMKISQLRRFPVVDDDGHPVGVVTLTDLARAETEHGENGGNSARIAAALAWIGEPRHSTLLNR